MSQETSPSWIGSTPWFASRYWWPTDHHAGHGSRCWRRSANSPRKNSSPATRPPRPEPDTPDTSPNARPETLALWDSPDSAEAYTWLFTIELPNLRVAFRWAADSGDLDTAAAIAFYTAFIGPWAEYYEPITWAEELIEPARAAEHPRLADLYGTAAQCWMPGRVEDAVRYSEPPIGNRGCAPTLVSVPGSTGQCIPDDRPARTIGALGPRPAGARRDP